MKSFMHIGKPFFLIKIVKSEQLAKQKKLDNGILLSSKFLWMKFNMQCGAIVDIGTHALREYPGAEVGDLLIFKHIIESQPWRLLKKIEHEDGSPADELLLVDVRSGTEIHGILKPDGTWIINKNYVFVYPEATLIQNSEYSGLLSVPNPELFLEESYITDKLDQLKADSENLKQSVESVSDPYKFEEQFNGLQNIQKEQAQLGSFLHSTKYCKVKVAMVNPQTQQETGITPGGYIFLDNKTLYDLNLDGIGKFKLCLTKYITGVLK